MRFSVAYNAEYYDKSVWAHDFELMKNAGVEAIRYAEFAWAIMEREEGKFDFSLIDDIVETAASFGIKSILCTPTACPPIWLAQNYEILPEGIDGRVSEVGSRQQRCYSSPDYLSHSYKIVEEMAKHFAGNENVVAWQIDNELCGEMKKCFCPRCRSAFDKYLENKYKTIDELNRRWGTQFWSQTYNDFSQIPTPKLFASDLNLWHNPALNLDYVRFSSDNIVNFANTQYDIIRKYTNVPITTNTDDFRFGDTLNLYKLFKKLDIAGIDVYSTDKSKIGFYCDFMRSVKPEVDKFWFLEFGDGCASPDLLDFISNRGAELMEIYKFRPYPWGQEQSRDSVVNIYGRPMWSYDVMKNFPKTDYVPAEKPKTALVYDFESSWAWHAKSLYLKEDYYDEKGSALKYPYYVEQTVYRAMFSSVDKIQMVDDTFDLSSYNLIVAPSHLVYSEALENSAIEFIKNGGTFICDTLLFQKDDCNAFVEKMPRIFTEVFGFENDVIIDDRLVGKGKEVKYGKGRAVIVRSELDLKQWKSLIKKYSK